MCDYRNLVIKEVSIRHLKSNGVQQRDTGFKETQRGIWLKLLSMLISSTFSLKMHEFTGV